MKIRNKAPSRAYMITVHNATVSDRRAATIEQDGVQLVANAADGCSEKEARAKCFDRVRRDYELLGKPKIEGWGIIIDRIGGLTTIQHSFGFSIRLYLRKP